MKTIFVIIYIIGIYQENGEVRISDMNALPSNMPSLIFDTREKCESYQMQTSKHNEEQKLQYSWEGYLRVHTKLSDYKFIEAQCIEIKQ